MKRKALIEVEIDCDNESCFECRFLSPKCKDDCHLKSGICLDYCFIFDIKLDKNEDSYCNRCPACIKYFGEE